MTPEYITLKEYVSRHTWPTIHGLRHLTKNSEKNGLREAGVIVRVGRRVLIDEAGFADWIGRGGGERQD